MSDGSQGTEVFSWNLTALTGGAQGAPWRVTGLVVATVGALLGALLYATRRARGREGRRAGAGMATSLGFKIGYNLYCKTRLGYMYFRHKVNKARSEFRGEGHSITQPTSINDLLIQPIPFSMDNYAYLVCDLLEGVAVLIDPADPDVIQAVLAERKLTPTAILTTHKHWDHSGGNEELRRRYPALRVYGGRLDGVPGATHPLEDDEVVEVGRLRFKTLLTPGHTVGHLVYVLDGSPFDAPPSLFSGDHLFIGSVGKVFEGNAATMLKSVDRICLLPDSTLIWPGHEYSLAGLQFAASLEPDHAAVAQTLAHIETLRRGRQCTCPSTLGAERTYNPYLRTLDPALACALGLLPRSGADTSPTEGQGSSLSGGQGDRLVVDERRARVLAECRMRKDAFKAPPLTGN